MGEKKAEEKGESEEEEEAEKRVKQRREREENSTAGHREQPVPPPPPLPHQLLPTSPPLQVAFPVVFFWFGFICMQNVYVLQQMKIN